LFVYIRLAKTSGTVRADSHYTSRFRSGAESHRSVKFSHVYLITHSLLKIFLICSSYNLPIWLQKITWKLRLL